MIKCGKFLTIKKEGSANQSEGCDARRKAQYGPPAALCSAALFNYAEMCQCPPKGSWCGVMEKFMGVAFLGTTITLPLRSGRLKYR
jgi:hypothetical protein